MGWCRTGTTLSHSHRGGITAGWPEQLQSESSQADISHYKQVTSYYRFSSDFLMQHMVWERSCLKDDPPARVGVNH